MKTAEVCGTVKITPTPHPLHTIPCTLLFINIILGIGGGGVVPQRNMTLDKDIIIINRQENHTTYNVHKYIIYIKLNIHNTISERADNILVHLFIDQRLY